jgi:hypothetical protein
MPNDMNLAVIRSGFFRLSEENKQIIIKKAENLLGEPAKTAGPNGGDGKANPELAPGSNR